MHRLISFLLSTLLLAGLCVPAMAASESADARLARVTQTVKETLALDTEAYPDFRGDVSEQELGTLWSLSWSGAGASMNVEALEDGTVVGFWRSDNEEIYYPTSGGSLSTFPQVDSAKAKAAAEAFLQRVLDTRIESVVLEEPAADRLGVASCRFYGTILLNGLPSPLSYSITVRGSDNVVTSFRRDASAQNYLGGVPSAKPAVGKDAAAASLKGTLKLELVYVTDENNTTKAVLRYVPKDQETFYVDAQTGKLVSPSDELFFTNDALGAATPAAMEEKSMDRGLTQAELEGVAKLEGVLDKEALAESVRAEAAYKLDGYTVSAADYRLIRDGENETVLCTLRFVKPDAENAYDGARVFSVDARTGAVRSLSSWSGWDKDRKAAVSAADAQRIAETFLTRFSAHAGEFALRETDDRTAEGAPSYGFTFTRKVNGYFFPENACTIRVDCMNGAVCGLDYSYDEKVSFDSASGIVSEAAALDAWMATYDVVLAYRAQPKALSKADADEAKLIALGYERFRTLLLTYALERENWVSGIDAKTGKPVAAPEGNETIAYDDVAGHWAAGQIETLARYGVGYNAGSFRPDKTLTQWELVALLASTQGMRVDPDNATAEERDSAYNTAFYMGALARTARDDEHVVTRGELVRFLIDCAGCGSVAKLHGIFTCAYADRADIPADELGYAALAQGFGLVTNERYESGAGATRAIAAVMLSRMMSRAV